MAEPGYGETQPRLEDDRLPVVLILLDGLGDRAQAGLDGLTPLEAARTPNLDELARRGACGLHVPMGPGRAPSSEVAHWSIFGFEGLPFPGRAVLEALGAGFAVADDDPRLYAALRSSTPRDGAIWISGRAAAADESDVKKLLADLPPRSDMLMQWIRLGEGVLRLVGAGPAAAAITDSDPFFEDRQPWLRALPHAGAPPVAGDWARRLSQYLLDVRSHLSRHPVNRGRVGRGLPALDTITTKWSGARLPLPTFRQRVGTRGGLVTSSSLYRGFAQLLDMDHANPPADPDPGRDMAARLVAAGELLHRGANFVHVHTKVVDEAGHGKRPEEKVRVLEALDVALAELLRPPFDRAVVAVTGDHATPSSGGVLHTGDPTPLLVAGGSARVDEVVAFGEGPCAKGSIGVLSAADLLPLLLGHANRAAFLGARATSALTVGFPDDVEPLLAAD